MPKRPGIGREGAGRTAVKAAVLALEAASRRPGTQGNTPGFNASRVMAAVLAVVAGVLLSLPAEASRGGNPGLDSQAFSKPPELLSSVAQSSVALRRSGEAIRFRLDSGVSRTLSESLEEAFVIVDLPAFETAGIDAHELVELAPAGLTFETRFERSILEGLGDRVTLGAKPPPCNGLCFFARGERSSEFHRARWYDPRTGVFLSEDPEADRDSRNYYAYAAFAPQQFTDPSGRFIDTAIDIFTTAYDVAKAATEYAKTGRISEETRNDLLMDAAGILIPGVSAGMIKGGAKVWRHVRKADEVLDAARAVSKGAKKAADGVDLAQDVAKAGRRIENGAEGVADASKFERRGSHTARQGERATEANQAARKVETTADEMTGIKNLEGACPIGRFANSFPEGTLVANEHGEKPIENVMPGENVFAYDELAKSFTLQPVAFRFVYQKDETLTLTVNGEEIVTTAGHPFFSAGKGWVEAGELAIGDGLLTLSGELARVEGLEKKLGEFSLFNFEVENDHSFFVGKNGLLVHNGCPTTTSKGPVRSRHYSESSEGARLHEEAKRFRARHPDGENPYRNFATADVVVDGKTRTVRFKNDPDGMHSEQRLVAWYDRMLKQGHDVSVKRVYTERPPCGPMRANCADTLAQYFGPNLEVLYSQRPKRFRR